MNGTHKQIFIVITQTGTMLSRILKRITGAEYNHASLSLSQDLTRMYSFGRRHPYNPFWGGFVIESPHAGTFRRFSDTTAIILAVEITEERYAALEGELTSPINPKPGCRFAARCKYASEQCREQTPQPSACRYCPPRWNQLP